jgi:hypothetical protein
MSADPPVTVSTKHGLGGAAAPLAGEAVVGADAGNSRDRIAQHSLGLRALRCNHSGKLAREGFGAPKRIRWIWHLFRLCRVSIACRMKAPSTKKRRLKCFKSIILNRSHRAETSRSRRRFLAMITAAEAAKNSADRVRRRPATRVSSESGAVEPHAYSLGNTFYSPCGMV